MGEKVDTNNKMELVKFYEFCDTIFDRGYMEIKTLEGTMRANIGDWIIKGVNGEFYPCKPNIFEKTYDKESYMTQERFFKLGVSDFYIHFENGNVVTIDTVNKETIVTDCENNMTIMLSTPCGVNELINNMDSDIDFIERAFVVSKCGEKIEWLMLYEDLEVSKIIELSECKSITNYNLIFKTKK